MDLVSTNALLVAAADALAVTLTPLLRGRGRVKRRIEDDVIRIEGVDGRLIVAQTVAHPSRPALLKAWDDIDTRRAAPDAIPVLIVPSLSPSLRALAAEREINWMDLAGNGTITHPALLLHVEGREPRRPPRGSGSDPFAPRSANIVRQLLAEPERAWRQKELVERTGVSQGQASKALGALQELALVRREDDGRLRVTDPQGLLDAWADAYRYNRQRIVPAHLTGDGIELARELDDRLRAAACDHWFTGLPAAWAYDRFASFRLVSVFVDGDPELVRQALGLREAARGGNVHLIPAHGQRLDIGQARPEGLPCAHPAQVYVDLLGLPERAREAAEHLRPLALAGHAA